MAGDMGAGAEWLIPVSTLGSTVAGVIPVAVWLARRRAEAAGVDCIVIEHGSPGGRPGQTTATVVNDSPFRVDFPSLTAWDHGRRRRLWRLLPQDRWMTGRRLRSVDGPKTLGRGEAFECGLPAPPIESPDGDPPPVTVRFRDRSGRSRHWIRWSDGKVTRLYPSFYWLQERRRARLRRRRASCRPSAPSDDGKLRSSDRHRRSEERQMRGRRWFRRPG